LLPEHYPTIAAWADRYSIDIGSDLNLSKQQLFLAVANPLTGHVTDHIHDVAVVSHLVVCLAGKS
jgi:hypothetical protein